jgi:hypothetical protein
MPASIAYKMPSGLLPEMPHAAIPEAQERGKSCESPLRMAADSRLKIGELKRFSFDI